MAERIKTLVVQQCVEAILFQAILRLLVCSFPSFSKAHQPRGRIKSCTRTLLWSFLNVFTDKVPVVQQRRAIRQKISHHSSRRHLYDAWCVSWCIGLPTNCKEFLCLKIIYLNIRRWKREIQKKVDTYISELKESSVAIWMKIAIVLLSLLYNPLCC